MTAEPTSPCIHQLIEEQVRLVLLDGVQIEQLALAKRFALSPYNQHLGPEDVLTAIPAVSWNPSVFEALDTLANGAPSSAARGWRAHCPKHAYTAPDKSLSASRSCSSMVALEPSVRRAASAVRSAWAGL